MRGDQVPTLDATCCGFATHVGRIGPVSHDSTVHLNRSALPPGPASFLCVRWSVKIAGPALGDAPPLRGAGWHADWAADWAADWIAAVRQLVLAHGGEASADAQDQLSATFEGGLAAPMADCAVRAVHCGLALLAAAAEHEALARQHAPSLTLTLQVGVHHPSLSDAQGHNVAARIAAAASVGRLCLCHDTAALVRTLFDVEPMVPLPSQTGQPSVQIGVLAGTRGGSGPPVAGAAWPVVGGAGLIGREAERLVLQRAYAQLMAQPNARRLTVLAEPGVGKSRLLADFDAWISAQPQPVHILRARAWPQTQARPFGLLRAFVCGHCRIDETDPPPQARQRLELAIAPWFAADEGATVAEGHAHSLAHLIGIDVTHSPHIRGILDDPRQIRQRAVHAARHWLRRLSAAGRTPVLLLLDDVQWTDDESLDFLDSLLQTNADTALLMVAFGRSELAQRRAHWLSAEVGQQHFSLPSLSATDRRALARALLAKLPALPSALVDGLIAKSGGHPQFIEERLHLLIDLGVITPGVDSWGVDMTRLRSTRLPATLSGVLKTRLALLPPEQRQALQVASVIGPSFSVAALQALGKHLAQALPQLVDRSWAVPQAGRPMGTGSGPVARPAPALPASAPAPSASFTFKHASLQQAAYASLPILTRRELHGTLARWLVAATVLGSPAAPAQTAQHFEQAGEDLLAAEHHVRAAQHAAALFAPEAALRHAQRGLEALQHLPVSARVLELRWQLLRRRVSAFEILGRDAQYGQDIAALAALADELGDDAKRTEAISIRCGQLLLSQDYAGLKLAARQSMALAERAGLDDFRISAMRMLADAHCGLGDWDAGARLARQALEQALALAQHSTAANCLNTLAAVAERAQDPLGRIGCHEQALALSRQIGDRRGEATQLVNLAGAWLTLGELVAAGQTAGQALTLARALGARLHESIALSHSATLALWLGQTQQALALATASVEAAIAAGAVVWQADAQLVLGTVALVLGDHTLAQQTFEQARGTSQGAQIPRWLDAIAGLARLALRRADVPAAMALVQQVLDLESATQTPHDAGSPRSLDLVIHRVLASADDARALSWLQRAHGQLMVTAASIADETLREGFLNNIPDHRAILAAWALAQEESRPSSKRPR